MNKTQINRLEKMATHLESGKLGHEHFDFSVVNAGRTNKKGCGTAGCVLWIVGVICQCVFCLMLVDLFSLSGHCLSFE